MEPGEGVLTRAMRVLQCFTDDEPALSATRIAELTGLPSSTLHRLLSQLTSFGLLTRTPGHRYTIGAKLWELRAAVSLARLWAEQGRLVEARDLLAPVHGWFTEGFDMPDLLEARALLDALALRSLPCAR